MKLFTFILLIITSLPLLAMDTKPPEFPILEQLFTAYEQDMNSIGKRLDDLTTCDECCYLQLTPERTERLNKIKTQYGFNPFPKVHPYSYSFFFQKKPLTFAALVGITTGLIGWALGKRSASSTENK